MFYWELIQHDGTRLEIPPNGVDVIKRRMEQGQVIHTAHSGSIPANQIKTFRPTEKPFTDMALLESASQAFNEPVYTEDGILARWVKKQVPQSKWDKYYAPTGYRKLHDMNGMVTVAFRLPVHQINQLVTPYCSSDEVKMLTK